MQRPWHDGFLTQQRAFGLRMASSTHESTARAIGYALERELKARVPNLKWCFIEHGCV